MAADAAASFESAVMAPRPSSDRPNTCLYFSVTLVPVTGDNKPPEVLRYRRVYLSSRQ
jgi:hypothetical protein